MVSKRSIRGGGRLADLSGPRSCLSLCSQSGIEWVKLQTGSQTYRQSAQRFITDITQRLKLSSGLDSDRTPDPMRIDALLYTQGMILLLILTFHSLMP